MARKRDAQIEYHDFRQRVRRYRLDDVLRLVAAENASIELEEQPGQSIVERPNFVQPFVLSGVARTAIVSCNNHRSGVFGRDQLFELCLAYSNIKEPALGDLNSGRGIRGLWNRISYEQFPHQYSSYENISRSLLLMEDYLPTIPGAPAKSDWDAVLGADLASFMRVGFTMYTAAIHNGGQITRDTLRMPHVRTLFERTGVEQALQLIDLHFAGDIRRHKEIGQAAEVVGLEKWSFNPLVAKPIISNSQGNLSMPWPWLLIDKITPNGLYHIGLKAFGSSFADSLGKAFEAYVGDHLRLLDAANIFSEIEYGSPTKLTVDYFVVLPELVILVEVKSARPVLATRIGHSDGDDDTYKKIGHAYEQISRTANLIRAGESALSAIPSDRPLAGLVVTLEPFHSMREFGYDDFLPKPDVPVAVVSAHELEGTIAMTRSELDIGQRALDAFFPEGGMKPTLETMRRDLPKRRSPIIEEGWARFDDE